MAFPSSNTVYVWRMNNTDCAFGVLDYADNGTVLLDRFSSINEMEGTLEQVAVAAQEANPALEVEIITDTTMLSQIDQFSSELRNAVFEDDELENIFILSM